MRNKLTALALAFLLGLVIHAPAQAAEADLSGIEKLPAHVQIEIYKSALELNRQQSLDLSAMGLANSSLQDAIVEKLDEYGEKGGPVTVYKFPVDKIQEVAALLDAHEEANDRMKKIGKRLKQAEDTIASLKHKVAKLEGKE